LPSKGSSTRNSPDVQGGEEILRGLQRLLDHLRPLLRGHLGERAVDLGEVHVFVRPVHARLAEAEVLVLDEPH
jgi:hypothetical protein